MAGHIESDTDFQIDRFQLELEGEKNSHLIQYYGKMSAKWGAIQKEEKRKLEVTQAECAEIIRQNPKAYGISKDTDAVVMKLAMNEPDYVKQHAIWLEAFEQDKYYEFAVTALIQKGSMIKQLVMLWLNNYYSSPLLTKKEVREPGKSSLLNKLKSNRSKITEIG
jgi:hypothetical protein